MDERYRKDLQLWFGLSYSSFCVMPRVFMEAMPKEWQEKMVQMMMMVGNRYLILILKKLSVKEIEVTGKSKLT